MNFWVITDTHLGHDKMHTYCQRPQGFSEKTLRQIKHKVKPDDVLIHLGDFCVYRNEHWHKLFVEACPGKRWLIRGNHDRKTNSWYLAHGWDFVGDQVLLVMFKKRILLSHKPVAEGDFDINIHGHHHNTGHHPEDRVDERHRLIFIEHEYTPIDLRAIVEVKRR